MGGCMKNIKVNNSWLLMLILFINIVLLYFVFSYSDLFLKYPISIIGVASVLVAAAGVIYSKEKEQEIQNSKEEHERKLQIDTNTQEKEEEFYMSLLMCRHYALTQADNVYMSDVNDMKIRQKLDNDGRPLNQEALNQCKEKKKGWDDMYDKLILEYRENYYKVIYLQRKYLFVEEVLFLDFEKLQKELFSSLETLHFKEDYDSSGGHYPIESYGELTDKYNKVSIPIYNNWSNIIEIMLTKISK